MHRPYAPQHPRRKHRRAPNAGEIAKSRSGIVRLAPTPRHLGEEILEGSGAEISAEKKAFNSEYSEQTFIL